jgi:hypothetical protein
MPSVARADFALLPEAARGRARSRVRSGDRGSTRWPAAWIRQPVPELRIIEHDLWVRQPDGVCGSALSRLLGSRGGKGLILDALRHNLMRPELVEEFVRAFHEETNRARHAAELQVEARRHELSEANRKLDGLIEANADGFRAPGLQTKLDALESRGVALSQELAEAAAPAPRLHTNLAELYAGQVATLHEALGRSHHARRGTGDHARADRARTGQARRDARQLRGRAGGRDRGDGGTGARREHKKPRRSGGGPGCVLAFGKDGCGARCHLYRTAVRCGSRTR